MPSSSPMPWIKLYTEFLNDRKIAKLDDIVKLRFIQLMLLAGECDAEGWLIDSAGILTYDDIAWRLRVDPVKLSVEIKVLIDAGIISVAEDGTLCVVNFSKRQDRPQSVKRQEWRERQRKHRDQPDSQDDVTPIVTRDTQVSNASREEEEESKSKRRGEKEKNTSTSTGKLIKLYEENIGALTKLLTDKLMLWVEDYPGEWFEPAFQIACENNKRNLAYVEAILKRWKIDGFKTDNRNNGRNSNALVGTYVGDAEL